MDAKANFRGLQYEAFMMRAFQLQTPALHLGADRRIYDQLYYIEKGYDLRNLGYWHQLMTVKNHVKTGLTALLRLKLYKDEKIALRLLQMKLETTYTELEVYAVIEEAMVATKRLERR